MRDRAGATMRVTEKQVSVLHAAGLLLKCTGDTWQYTTAPALPGQYWISHLNTESVVVNGQCQ